MHLVDISPRQLEEIQSLIDVERYESVDQLLGVALRNQLMLETRRAAPSPEPRTRVELSDRRVPPNTPDAPSSSDLESDHYSATRVALASLPASNPEVVGAVPATGPLFGQYYRFLPLKLVAREICAASKARLPDLPTIAKRIATSATELGARLREADTEETLNLSTGFPSTDRDAEKSIKRFVAQYLGRPRPKRALDGFGADLGFFGITADETPRIGLTEAGFKFAHLPNPVLDEGARRALSDEEVVFIVGWLKGQLADEYNHAQTLLAAINDGHNTPATLTAAAWEYYKRRFPKEGWTDAKVTLTRSGVVSRLQEMQLLTSSKDGSRVTYALTRDGAKLLNASRGK